MTMDLMMHLGMHARAVRLGEAALQLRPESTHILISLGNALNRLRRFGAAIAYYQRAAAELEATRARLREEERNTIMHQSKSPIGAMHFGGQITTALWQRSSPMTLRTLYRHGILWGSTALPQLHGQLHPSLSAHLFLLSLFLPLCFEIKALIN